MSFFPIQWVSGLNSDHYTWCYLTSFASYVTRNWSKDLCSVILCDIAYDIATLWHCHWKSEICIWFAWDKMTRLESKPPSTKNLKILQVVKSNTVLGHHKCQNLWLAFWSLMMNECEHGLWEHEWPTLVTMQLHQTTFFNHADRVTGLKCIDLVINFTIVIVAYHG